MGCNSVEKDFQFWMPLEIEKAKKEGEWRVAGIASDENAQDIQGETVFVKGLDVSYLMERGALNWDHGKDPGDILGEIELASKIDGEKKLYVEGVLYPHIKKAQDVWNLMQSLKDTESKRKLGLSLEGKIKERDSETGKQIRKAWIKNVAITYNPINKGTYLDMVKSLGKFSFDLCDKKCEGCTLCEEVEKASEGSVTIDPVVDHKETEVKKAEVKVAEETKPIEVPLPSESVQKTLEAGQDIPATTGGVSGSALRAESLEQETKVTTYQKKKKKQKTDGEFTKSELAEWLQEERNYSPKTANLMANLLFLVKAINIAGYIRTRKGKLERVKPFTRELTHEIYRIKTMSDSNLMTRARKIKHADKMLHFYHAAVAAGKPELVGYIRSQGHRLGLTNSDFTGAAEPVGAGLKEASRAFRAAA